MNLRQLNNLKNLSLFKTLYYAVRNRSFRFLITKRSRIIAKGSIVGPGQMIIGNTWENAPFKPTLLSAKKGSKIFLRGKFKIFTGSEVRVASTGTLILSSGFLNEGCVVECFHHIEIGHNATIARNVIIRDSDSHSLDDRPQNGGAIKIGDNVWIGMNSIILKNVSIGDGAVIAAGSVVNRDVEGGTLVAGVPARFVRRVSWK